MVEMFGYRRDEMIGRTTGLLYADPADYRRVGGLGLAISRRRVERMGGELRHATQ